MPSSPRVTYLHLAVVLSKYGGKYWGFCVLAGIRKDCSGTTSPLVHTTYTHRAEQKKHKLYSNPHSTPGLLLRPQKKYFSFQPPRSLRHQTVFQRKKKSSLIVGLIFSFAAGASFGVRSFRNKCLINNGHRIQQGRHHEGREAMRNTMMNGKLCVRSGRNWKWEM